MAAPAPGEPQGAMRVLRVEGLPAAPLDAAAAFHARWLARARAELADGCDLVLVFPPAAHPHDAWRLAAVQELAREAAPLRVNALVGDTGEAIAAMLDWLAGAGAVTGQVLTVES